MQDKRYNLNTLPPGRMVGRFRGVGAVLAAAGMAMFHAVGTWAAESAPAAPSAVPQSFAKTDEIFADFATASHIPGLVYGIVADGKLAHVRGFGVQDLQSSRPVTPDSLFRIASMTKAFTALTILKLRDEGRLLLDALAETYVPEMRGWKYPTLDSPRIRVRDLLNHTAGFVTDDPWGDRQTPMPEAEFSKLLQAGVPFTRAPGIAMEYSNLGYALLGRIITNVSGKPYAETITQSLLKPLGMDSTGFVVDAFPAERRALGYRWESGAWRLEPTMAHGAFGAMGGIQTSAADYAKWVAYLLSAWPPRDGASAGPVQRATVRELSQGSNFPALRQRPGRTGPTSCRQAATYGMGMAAATDCDVGMTLSHGGGYPGYGSFVLLLPEYGVGLFAFANRTYAGPAPALWDAAIALKQAGFLKSRPALPISDALANAYRAVGMMFKQGSLAAGENLLAMNFLLDRDAAAWNRDLANLQQEVGTCETASPIAASGALSAEFTWTCASGMVSGSILLAPTDPPRIQALRLTKRKG